MLDLSTITVGEVDALSSLIEKKLCERSLVQFIKAAWHVIEPGSPYVHGWHIDFLCDHLEAITDELVLEDGSYYNRLLANVPPGTMKSLIVNVFWPAWEWGPRNMPHLRYVCAAHKVENLSARDSRRMRLLITSDWYKGHWGDRVQLARDQNEKLNFVNSAGGFRIATAITSLTGIRGDRVIIDDPHSVDSASSEAMRKTEVTTFLEAIPTRLNNPERSAIVVIMQRLHEEDVSGAILENDLGYDHIMLPMRYDPDRAFPTKLGAIDPREEDGELLFPERFPLHIVERDERAMGPFATAGQFQQSPKPAGGAIIERDWWQPWDEANYPDMEFILASLDTAYGEKQYEGDYHALTIWGVWRDGGYSTGIAGMDARFGGTVRRIEKAEKEGDVPKVMLMYAMQGRWPLHELVQKVGDACRKWKVDRLVIEKAASGVAVEQELRRAFGYEDWGTQLVTTKGLDKVARTYSIQHIFSEGIVHAPNTAWAEQVISQSEYFPKGKHDDLHDTVTQALSWLRASGMIQRGIERTSELAESKQFRGNKGAEPLYPV